MQYLLKSNWFLALAILAAATFTACDDDEPMPSGMLQADFSFEVSSDDPLQVAFTSTSTEAESFSWDFGDGNSSSEENPTHTYERSGIYTVSLTVTQGTESDDATKEVALESPYKTSGYWITSAANSSAGSVTYGGYFEELPEGNIDLTQYQSFPVFNARRTLGPFLFGSPTDGVNQGVVKYAIDAENGQLEEIGSIPTLNLTSVIEIIDEELGFYTSFRELTVYAFNPSTMEDISAIDLSDNSPLPEGEDFDRGVSGLYHNPNTGKIYAALYFNDPNTGQFYDDVNIYVEVIDVASLSREKTITHPEATYPIFRGERNVVLDEAGNLYLIAQGSYGLDLQVGPTAAERSRPQILKINTNSEFDLDYSWNPINAVGLTNNAFQLFVSMVGAGNNKAYGIGTGGTESPEVMQLLQKLAAGTITDAEYQQLQFLVFADESQRVIEIDLVAQTAAYVEGMPQTAGFGYPYMYNYDGTIFTQMTANGGTFNGFYRIDPETNEASEQFNISQGGLGFQLLKLSKR